MVQKVKKQMPYILGSVIAVVLFFVPEARPIACGAGFVLPSLVS